MPRQTTPHSATALSATSIVQIQYFLYFAVMGLTLPYFNLYLSHIRLDGIEIGILSGIRSGLMMVAPLTWSLIADRLKARRRIYILLNLGATLIWTGYFLTTQFPWLLVIGLLHGFLFTPIIAFLEAFSLDTLGRDKNQYGRNRLWGSVAFILVVVGCGRLFDRIGVASILVLVLAGCGLQFAFSFFIPRDTVPKPSSNLGLPEGLRSREAIVFLLSVFLMIASHGGYYGFISIHLEELGFDKTFTGVCWAVASICEIGVMANSRRIFSRFRLKTVLVFSLGVAAIRWIALSVFTTAVPILISQGLHAITYAAFHMAGILTIDRFASDRFKTFAQALNNSIGYGMGLTAGFIASGWLYERLGYVWMFQVSALIALCGVVVFLKWGRIPDE
ncbi:MAG: MFS transporter [Thermodesulfobacteriota bacterium]